MPQAVFPYQWLANWGTWNGPSLFRKERPAQVIYIVMIQNSWLIIVINCKRVMLCFKWTRMSLGDTQIYIAGHHIRTTFSLHCGTTASLRHSSTCCLAWLLLLRETWRSCCRSFTARAVLVFHLQGSSLNSLAGQLTEFKCLQLTDVSTAHHLDALKQLWFSGIGATHWGNSK